MSARDRFPLVMTATTTPKDVAAAMPPMTKSQRARVVNLLLSVRPQPQPSGSKP